MSERAYESELYEEMNMFPKYSLFKKKLQVEGDGINDFSLAALWTEIFVLVRCNSIDTSIAINFVLKVVLILYRFTHLFFRMEI